MCLRRRWWEHLPYDKTKIWEEGVVFLKSLINGQPRKGQRAGSACRRAQIPSSQHNLHPTHWEKLSGSQTCTSRVGQLIFTKIKYMWDSENSNADKDDQTFAGTCFSSLFLENTFFWADLHFGKKNDCLIFPWMEGRPFFIEFGKNTLNINTNWQRLSKNFSFALQL